VPRSLGHLLNKAGNAISIANTRAAELQASNIRFQAQLDLLQIKAPRKQVPKNPTSALTSLKKSELQWNKLLLKQRKLLVSLVQNAPNEQQSLQLLQALLLCTQNFKYKR
jgi:hypothetical protein